MTVASFYRRILPSPPAIDFSSPDGKQLFIEAIQGGTMEGFFKLISSFQTQSEPAYCGLASLAMVLNALAIDPGRKWKGPWRWFDESMLDCCEALETVKAKGISFGKVVCLAHCAGAKVEAYRANQSTLDDFRNYVMSCSSSDDCHIISSYDRRTFKQTGSGHFSPIGGYHAGRDMVLILDVARFKYPPHWVPLPLLWEAMNTVDEASGYLRGFMLISKLHRAPSLLYTLSCKHESWVSIAKYLVDDVPVLLSLKDVAILKDVLSVVFNSLPSKFLDFIKWVAEIRRREGDGQSLSQEEKDRLTIKEEILKEVQEIDLYKHVSDYILTWKSCCKHANSSNIENSLSKHANSSNIENSLSNIAASVCCQGAEILEGNASSSDGFCCRETRVKSIQSNGDTVIKGNAEERVDMTVPASPRIQSCSDSDSSSCIGMHPATNDVLTVLLLALPPQTWTGIKDQQLLQEIHSLLSVDSLSALLQEEVLHLRGQLLVLQRCKDDRVEEELGTPLF